ncbi:MAG TPA: C45 family peptidase [Candidatus Acidoferrales bacterium]|nr:C45 family peptidase [Candidatus Acidoferrales bacterium]
MNPRSGHPASRKSNPGSPVLVAVIFAVLLAGSGIRRHSALAAAGAAPARAGHRSSAEDARLEGSYRFERSGWIYVHLQGSPQQIGFQHGYLLAPEIQDAFAAIKLEDTHGTGRDWSFFRQAAHDMLWPKIDSEYQAELEGIVEGLEARGAALDLDDVVALNAFQELAGYYVPWYDTQHGKHAGLDFSPEAGHCSAFVATGSYTRGGDIVIGHNNWTTYADGERWRIIFDIAPRNGYRILMDGFPGVIDSDDDFGINSAGMMVTETTISQFYGWDPSGKPEFMRARKALQYAGSIDDYVRIINDGNNGGYANDWLLADRKTGEIARFEQGLKHTRLWRTKDGYFVGSNFPSDPQIAAGETKFDLDDPAGSANARHARWDQLMKQYRGQIDVRLAEQFEADHFDAYARRKGADERTLCGHIDASPRGSVPFEPFGATQGKVVDSGLAARMSFIAHLGHPCGESFYAKPFLAAHPQFAWEASILRDMPAGPWTQFSSGESARP